MTRVEIVRELRGDGCFCKRMKPVGRSFCSLCYNSLSVGAQKALWRHLDEGYCDAYRAARAELGSPVEEARRPRNDE